MRFGRIGALALHAAILASVGPIPARADVVLDAGTFLLDDDDAHRPDGAASRHDPGWEPVSLPDRWAKTRAATSVSGQYRIPFTLAAVPREIQAVYVPWVSMNAAVYVNDVWIGQEGSRGPPIAQNWNRPLLFAFSPALLRAGENTVLVRLQRLAHCAGGLGPLRVGDLTALAPLRAERFFWQVEIPRITTIVSAVIAIVMGVFWLGLRDVTYAAFAAVSVLCAVASLNYHVRDIPIASEAWEALVCSALLLTAPAFALFAHRLAGWKRPRVELALAGFAAGSLALFVLPHDVFHPWFNALGLVAIGVAGYGLAPVLDHARRDDPALVFVYTSISAIVLGVAVHDLAIQLDLVSRDRPHWMAIVAPMLVAGWGLMLTRRFVRAFRLAERQRDELDRRVREKHDELEHSFERLRSLERERAVATERERLMREMHDGIGSHLVRTISMVERRAVLPEEVSAALRAALDDMRLVIDSLDPGVDDLTAVLANVRERLGPRIERGGLRFEWGVCDLPPLPWLRAEHTLDVLRIVQEAVANVLQHAHATRICVTTARAPAEDGTPGVVLEIRDDGVGIDGKQRTGRGLGNMRSRARRLGGSLQLEAARPEPGTRLVLWLPEEPPPGPAAPGAADTIR